MIAFVVERSSLSSLAGAIVSALLIAVAVLVWSRGSTSNMLPCSPAGALVLAVVFDLPRLITLLPLSASFLCCATIGVAFAATIALHAQAFVTISQVDPVDTPVLLFPYALAGAIVLMTIVAPTTEVLVIAVGSTLSLSVAYLRVHMRLDISPAVRRHRIMQAVALLAALAFAGLMTTTTPVEIFRYTDMTPTPDTSLAYADTQSTNAAIFVTWADTPEAERDCKRFLMSLYDVHAFASSIPQVRVLVSSTDTDFARKATAMGDVRMVKRTHARREDDLVTVIKGLQREHPGWFQLALLDPGVIFRSQYAQEAYGAGLQLHRSLNVAVIANGDANVDHVTHALATQPTVADAIAAVRQLDVGWFPFLTSQDLSLLTPDVVAQTNDKIHRVASAGFRKTMLYPGDDRPEPMVRPVAHLGTLREGVEGVTAGNFFPFMYMTLDERFEAAEWMTTRRVPVNPADDAYVVWLTKADHVYAGQTLTFVLSLRLYSKARIIIASHDDLTKFPDIMHGFIELNAEYVFVDDALPHELLKLLTVQSEAFFGAFQRILSLNINTYLSKIGSRPVKRMAMIDIDMFVMKNPDALFEHPSPITFTKDIMLDWHINGGMVKLDLPRLGDIFNDLVMFAEDPANCCQFPGQFWAFSDQELLSCFAINQMRNVPFLASGYNQIDAALEQTHGMLLAVYNDTMIHHMTGYLNTGRNWKKIWNFRLADAMSGWNHFFETVECINGERLTWFDYGHVKTAVPGICSRCYCPHDPQPNTRDVRTWAWYLRNKDKGWFGSDKTNFATGEKKPFIMIAGGGVAAAVTRVYSHCPTGVTLIAPVILAILSLFPGLVKNIVRSPSSSRVSKEVRAPAGTPTDDLSLLDPYSSDHET
ncbi:hypothetical protein J8273_5599 [Carpediemonas membranifera]|uniref:Uncharacterized protein n=1 Tax=Carpediemonas membranifera TaxID=201153 RepID=A0A8J6B2R2_9EUKA|nr:hypothetical protein J8273_5599 [Carpediemonas membranifera]|eukprot:KAG9393004.1 hypothetical protein J8273_5599 [Carpediemonas membranifera]